MDRDREAWWCPADDVRADDSGGDDSRRRFAWMGQFRAAHEYGSVDISMLFGCEIPAAADWIWRTTGGVKIRHHQLVRHLDARPEDNEPVIRRLDWAARIGVQGHHHRESRQHASCRRGGP